MKHYIYIDESGSINGDCRGGRWFVIALLCVTNKDKLKRVMKRFIQQNIGSLRKLEKSRMMFKEGKLTELKGAALTPMYKRKFLEYFAQKDLFKVVFIKVNNTRLQPRFCDNTARSFNYLIRKTIQVLFDRKILEQADCHICIDERNVRTGSRHTLEDYLNTELRLALGYDANFYIEYHDSCNNKLIQLADVFSNIFFSSIFNRQLRGDLRELEQKGYVPLIFEFPLDKISYCKK